MTQTGWSLGSLALVAGALMWASGAGAEDPGVTDFTSTSPTAIESTDIVEALAVPRGTRINPARPPTARLPIYFEFDSTDLRPEAQKLLERVSVALRSQDLEGFQFSVEGHTDNVGPDQYNESLSTQRARAVLAFLKQRGVSEERLRAVGKGESKPATSNDTEEGRKRNRRVELINLGAP